MCRPIVVLRHASAVCQRGLYPDFKMAAIDGGVKSFPCMVA
jgi:hypothetical protein